MEDVKLEIIQTATDLFMKFGLRSVSVDDVCRQMHISKKTFYSYFKRKEKLIEAVLDQVHSKIKTNCFDSEEDISGKNIIELLMESDPPMKSTTEAKNKNFSFYYDLEKYYPRVFNKQVKLIKNENIKIISLIIQRGIEEDLFRKDIDMDIAPEYIAMQFQAGMEIQRNQKKTTHQQILNFFKDVMIRILVNEKGLSFYNKTYYNKTKK